MEKEVKKRVSKEKQQRSAMTTSTPNLSSKAIRKESGNVVRQYPAEVGYHGSGDETKLNPEE